ncbi:MAG: hypothetical protein AAF620_06860 [Bacteroidota bacterium]
MEASNQIQTAVILISLSIGVLISLRSFYGFFSESTYKAFDRIVANVFIVSLYAQVIFIVYVFTNFSFNYEESLKAIEHAALIIFATILTQGGRLITIRSNDNSVKFKFRSIYYGLATGLLIYAYVITLNLSFS